MADEIVDAYLNHPPYYGKSDYRQLAAIKQLCGPTCCYDPTRKLWGTSCTEALQYLIASKKWEPVGVSSDLHAALVRAAREHGFWNEADYVAGVEEAEAAKRKQTSALPRAGARLKNTKKAAAPAPAPAPVLAKKRAGVQPTAAEVAECARFGFTEQAIAYSSALLELGPRGTLSNEGRLLRWCALDKRPSKQECAANELSREERRRSWNYEDRWPLPYEESCAYAVELNGEAMRAASEGAEAR
jgi:hypothetical protein